MNKIIIADVMAGLQILPDALVQCVVTSPPYYGLRNYNIPATDWPEISYAPMPGLPPVTIAAQSCCLGDEADPLDFVGHIVLIFREVRRVLKDDGTLFLNLGDSYAGGKKGRTDLDQDSRERLSQFGHKGNANKNYFGEEIKNNKIPQSLKPKDLIGIPARVALALQADGWFWRQDIIWAKPNPMPESVTDRCTKNHEYILFFSKSKQYFFDAEAIATPIAVSSLQRISQNIGDQKGSIRPNKSNGPMKAVLPRFGGAKYGESQDPDFRTKSGNEYSASETSKANRRSVWEIEDDEYMQFLAWKSAQKAISPDVWEIATKSYSEAHFAVFPPELPERCIKAGSKAGDLILDPFMGSGTTAEVALPLGRQYVGIEAGIQNVALQKKRINNVLGLFCDPFPTWQYIG